MSVTPTGQTPSISKTSARHAVERSRVVGDAFDRYVRDADGTVWVGDGTDEPEQVLPIPTGTYGQTPAGAPGVAVIATGAVPNNQTVTTDNNAISGLIIANTNEGPAAMSSLRVANRNGYTGHLTVTSPEWTDPFANGILPNEAGLYSDSGLNGLVIENTTPGGYIRFMKAAIECARFDEVNDFIPGTSGPAGHLPHLGNSTRRWTKAWLSEAFIGTGHASDEPAVIIKGAPSQSVPVLQVKDSGDVSLLSVGYAGDLIAKSGVIGGQASNVVALKVKGAASQSVNLLTITDSSDVTLLGVRNDGRLLVANMRHVSDGGPLLSFTGTGIDATALTAYGTDDASVCLKVRAGNAQSNDIQQWIGAGAVVLSRVGKNGRFVTAVATAPVLGDLANGELALSTDASGNLIVTSRIAGALKTATVTTA